MIWKAKGFQFKFPQQVLLMGILNLTPDSFSGDGVDRHPQKALDQAQKIADEGADILDIGAESTRPGAREVSSQHEIKRLLPVLKKIRPKIHIPISIDTQKSEVARVMLEEGAQIINDVSGFRRDPELAQVIAHYGAGLILMHSRGNSRTMLRLNRYRELLSEIKKEMRLALQQAKKAGISRNSIVVDPGIGFAKRGKQNFELLRNIEQFQDLGYPICLGISRKSFIGETVNESPEKRDYGTTALHSLLVERGVNILRVHSVGAAKQGVQVTREFLTKAKVKR